MTEQGILNIIDKIADKLSIPTTEIINAYMASGIRDAVCEFVFLLIAVIPFIFVFRVYKNEKKREEEYRSEHYYWDNEDGYWKTWSLCIVSFFGTLMFIIGLPNLILWITNPKAYAILELMRHFH